MSDSSFLCSVYLLLAGSAYIYSVVWIGTNFHSFHQKQIKELVVQSTYIDHVILLHDAENPADSARRVVCSVKNMVSFLEKNDGTPKLFGIRLDKVLWKTMGGVVLSAVVSGLALFTKQ